MAFKLPPLPNAQLFDENGYPTSVMQQYWQELTGAVTGALLTLANVTGVILPSYDQAIKDAKKAASDANAAAAAAQKAASDSAAMAAANAREQALVNSYIDPSSVLTATPTTISIAAHTRHYADGTTASVNAGTVAATASGDTDYVSYSDPTRKGGAVTYIVSTTQSTQIGDTHVVGAVKIPATGLASGGKGPQPPGYVQP